MEQPDNNEGRVDDQEESDAEVVIAHLHPDTIIHQRSVIIIYINESTIYSQDDEEDDGHVIQIKLQNIVSTVNLGVRLDLDKITSTARNAEYNPKRFQAVIVRIREPRTTALIFASGKMIVTGAKTIKDSRNAALKYTAIVQKVGFPATFKDFKVQNLTATSDAGFPIRLEGLIYAHSACATYEPELFPGLVYRMVEPKVSLLIFVSGKVVLTGAKTTEQLTAALLNIHPFLTEFRKKNVITNNPAKGKK